MVVGCYMGSKTNHRAVYRGVFANPLDYDSAVGDRRRAGLRKLRGKEPTETQQKSIERLERLEERGGIDSRLLPSRQ